MVAMTLLQRVVAGNALVVLVGAMILAPSPATISPQITGSEAGVLARASRWRSWSTSR